MEGLLVDRVISGRVAARAKRARIKERVAELRELGIHPRVSFVRIGHDPASEIYVNAKERACGWVGIRSSHIHLPPDTTADALNELVDKLNNDDDVDGVLVQMPLPESFSSKDVLNRIRPDKDVDGFHVMNLGSILAGRGAIEPCTPAGIMYLIRELGIDPTGMEAVVVGRSAIVGRPMGNLLLRANATVTTCHRHTQDLAAHVARAQILVVAAGVKHLVKGAWIRPGAWVFDVGITREGDQLYGDVEFDEAIKRAAGITPVPGGVGPMTIAQLLENTVTAASIRRGLRPNKTIRA